MQKKRMLIRRILEYPAAKSAKVRKDFYSGRLKLEIALAGIGFIPA